MSSNDSRGDKKRDFNMFSSNGFNFSSYPMTNPPLFDQSMFVNYNQDGTPVLRRRISISNGQIGQIINHEAIFDENYDLLSADTTPIDSNDKNNYTDYSGGATGDMAGNNLSQMTLNDLRKEPSYSSSQAGLMGDLITSTGTDVSQQRAQNLFNAQNAAAAAVEAAASLGAAASLSTAVGVSAPQRTTVSPRAMPLDITEPSLNPNVGPGTTQNPQQITPQQMSVPQVVPQVPPAPAQYVSMQGMADQSTTAASAADATGEPHRSFAGVPPPNHQLIYNNEVIFNPNNGPVPGTAAWKRDRLLERNRIAASKCRKRKKQAQQQLVDDVRDLKVENSQLRGKLDSYDKFFTLIQTFFNKTSNFENFDSTTEEFDIISKALKTDTQKALFEVLESYKLPDEETAIKKE